jgi:hypothetical protein
MDGLLYTVGQAVLMKGKAIFISLTMIFLFSLDAFEYQRPRRVYLEVQGDYIQGSSLISPEDFLTLLQREISESKDILITHQANQADNLLVLAILDEQWNFMVLQGEALLAEERFQAPVTMEALQEISDSLRAISVPLLDEITETLEPEFDPAENSLKEIYQNMPQIYRHYQYDKEWIIRLGGLNSYAFADIPIAYTPLQGSLVYHRFDKRPNRGLQLGVHSRYIQQHFQDEDPNIIIPESQLISFSVGRVNRMSSGPVSANISYGVASGIALRNEAMIQGNFSELYNGFLLLGLFCDFYIYMDISSQWFIGLGGESYFEAFALYDQDYLDLQFINPVFSSLGSLSLGYRYR